jgi:multimeric flavodoxin WrbA
VLGSARPDGNTEVLARHAARHLPVGVRQQWLHLDDYPLPRFADSRPERTEVSALGAHECSLLEATLAATDIVFASPLYWYSVSASMKLYLDYWSNWLRVTDVGFKDGMRDKTFWCVTVLSDDDPARADPLIGTLRLCADYLGARWGGELLGNGSRPADVLRDVEALERARTFFAEVPCEFATAP